MTGTRMITPAADVDLETFARLFEALRTPQLAIFAALATLFYAAVKVALN
jgi:hypothetical protein